MEFAREQKVLKEHLRNFNGHLNHLVPMKEQELAYYKQFAEFLNKYEDTNEKSRTALARTDGGDIPIIKLVSGDTKAHLKNKLNDLAQQLNNPFKHIRNWIKGEVMNLQSLMDAIAQKDSCDERKANSIRKLAADREHLAKLQSGKFQLKTMFKSSGKKQDLIHKMAIVIAQRQQDIENWDTIKRLLTIYLAEVAIPAFRRAKTSKYVFSLEHFSLDELKNAQKHIGCW